MHTRTAIAVLSARIAQGGAEIQLFPAGAFRAWDGRPEKPGAWRIDAAIAARVIAKAQARANPFVIDYEHQTLLAEKNGQAAPAAGWFGGADLVWREGSGLWATNPAWTAKAKAHIEADEYKYLSPVFEFDAQTGAVLALRMAALTNDPGLDGMHPVSAAALKAVLAAEVFPHPPVEEHPMNETLQQLLAALGLPETTPEADALAGVAALKAKAEEQTTQIAALKAETGKAPDPEKYVAVAVMKSLQDEVAALTARLNDGDAEQVIQAALKDGRLLPAQEDWARALGKKDVAALRAYVAATPANPALAGMQSQDKGLGQGHGGNPPLNDADLAVMKALGLTAEQFATGKPKE